MVINFSIFKTNNICLNLACFAGIGYFSAGTYNFMKLFDEHVVLRLLLLIVGVLFSLFAGDLVTLDAHPYWVIPYSGAVSFIFFVALFYSFGKPISFNRMRKDVDIQAPVPHPPMDEGVKDKLAETQAFVNLVFSSKNNGFWAYDLPTGKIQWSPKVAEFLGIEQDALGDSFESIRDLFFETDWTNFTRILNLALDSDQEFSADLHPIHANTVLTITGKPQRNSEGRPIRIAGAITQKPLHETKPGDTYLDELTKLKNRRYFQEHLQSEASHAQKDANYTFAMVLVDLEHFGNINDMYSEKFGDALLKVVADRITAACGVEDCIARLGADLFGIIIHNVQSKDNSEIVDKVQAIHSKVRSPLQLEGRELLIGASIAVVMSSDVEKADDIMANAMVLLRNLKNGESRSGIQFFTSGIREKAMHLYKMEFELRKAILAKDFSLVYQPVVDIFDNNKVVSFEALVRWNNSERGMVSPAEFIPIAEDSGLIVPLGELILYKACKQAKSWVDKGFKDLRIAVNFSAKQFAQENLIDNLCSILEQTQLNPRNLKIEITEYTAMNDSEKTVELMRRLTSMGLEISIDDFGTGFSSLSYLKKFPVHTLKIDKSFVDTVTEKDDDAAFVKMIIGIAKALNLDIIAEGVETREQLEFLHKEGCRHIQGYYFSKPLAPDNALEFMIKQNALSA